MEEMRLTFCLGIFLIYRKFFGSKENGPQRQTKLAFSSKASKKVEPKAEEEEAGDEAVSAKENADPQQGKGLHASSFQTETLF